MTCEIQGRVLLITLNRPAVRNAINASVARGLEEAIDRLEADEDLRVGILAAEGRAFCAGADLKVIAGEGLETLFTPRGGFAGFVRRDRVKPVIAAVDGAAIAGGCELVLACDLVVASTDAEFGLPEVRRCLVAAGGGIFRLAKVIPRAIAMELLITGDSLSARRAYELGMVNRLVEPGSVLGGALTLAGRVMANSPLAVRESRRALLGAEGRDEATGWALSADALDIVRSSDDHREGLDAFLSKRMPVWSGR